MMLPFVNYDLTHCQKHLSPRPAAPGGMRLSTAPEESPKTRPRRGKDRTRRGATLIEFTLVMPLLMLTMTGMVAFGLAIRNEMVLTNAVNTGAQALAFSRGQTTDPCATAYSAISNAAPSLTSSLSVTYVLNGTTYTTNTCAGGTANMIQGTSAQVSATYPCALGVFGESFNCHLGAATAELIQ